MADKTIGQLDTVSAVEHGLQFAVENTNGETKKVTLNSLLGSGTSSIAVSDLVLKRNNSTGICEGIPYANFLQEILANHIEAGSNVTISSSTTQSGVVLTISATGGSGSTWYFGSTAPQNAESGDYWLHTDAQNSGNVDVYDGTAWTNVGTFAGRDGVTPTIDDSTKHWLIGGTDTGVTAEGQDGSDGQAATVTIGTVTTGAAGTNASVTNSGTQSAAVLDFVIPRGADGSGTTLTAGDGIDITSNAINVKLGTGLTLNSQTGNIDVVGGGGSSYTETVLATPEQTVSTGSTIILSQDYTDFDAIIIIGSYTSGAIWVFQNFIISVDALSALREKMQTASDSFYLCAFGYNNFYFGIQPVADNEIKMSQSSGYIHKVIGITY